MFFLHSDNLSRIPLIHTIVPYFSDLPYFEKLNFFCYFSILNSTLESRPKNSRHLLRRDNRITWKRPWETNGHRLVIKPRSIAISEIVGQATRPWHALRDQYLGRARPDFHSNLWNSGAFQFQLVEVITEMIGFGGWSSRIAWLRRRTGNFVHTTVQVKLLRISWLHATSLMLEKTSRGHAASFDAEKRVRARTRCIIYAIVTIAAISSFNGHATTLSAVRTRGQDEKIIVCPG